MERIGKVEFTIFDYFVQIVVTDDIVKSRNKRAPMLGSTYTEIGTTKGLHSYNDGLSNAYLFLNPDTDAGTIAHECFHAIHRMFKRIGAEIEEEITAYYLGYLVLEVTKFIGVKKRK
jgi:hypothetical protein